MPDKTKPTIAEAIYRNTQNIRQLLQPIAKMAEHTQSPAQQSPLETFLDVQQATLEAIQQLRQGQEQIIGLLSDPSIEKAIREMLKN